MKMNVMITRTSIWMVLNRSRALRTIQANKPNMKRNTLIDREIIDMDINVMTNDE